MKPESQNTSTVRPLNLSETARRNHEELFPNHKSTLQVTDPELIELFDNFAFDEVLAHSDMDMKTRLMMILAALIGAHAVNEYKIMAGAALNAGVTPVEMKEILYQSVSYVGMGRAFDFLTATNEVFTDHGIPFPLESQSTTDAGNRFEKGLAVQKAIFGKRIDEMYEQSPKDLLHIQGFMSASCFGAYYTRNGLDLKLRELVTLSILIAMGGTEPQIKGHIQGNLNVGNTRAVLADLITQLLPWVGYPRTLNALKCLNETVPPAEK